MHAAMPPAASWRKSRPRAIVEWKGGSKRGDERVGAYLWVFHKRKKDESRDTKIVSPYMYFTVRRRKEERMERKGTKNFIKGWKSTREE
jgi:hypothetical protein